jgi:GGDEF domain-containing protein
MCRYGRKAFAPTMPGLDPEQAANIAEQLRMAREKRPFIIKSKKNIMKLMINIGAFGKQFCVDISHDEIVRRADVAFYQS